MPTAVTTYLEQVRAAITSLSEAEIEHVIGLLRQAHADGRRVFLFGNGGSAATATHIAEDLQKAVKLGTGKPFRAISLCDNVSLITAWSNDADYSCIFAEQLDSLLEPGDVVIAISGSGNSPNVICGVEKANAMGAVTIGLAGRGGGKLAKVAQHALVVQNSTMAQIEDVHLILGHLICTCLAGGSTC